MNVLIVFESRFGNNARIADFLSSFLKDRGDTVGVLKMGDADPKHLPVAELYLLGSPTQIGTLPLKVDRFVRRLTLPAGTRFAVFATHAESDSQTARKMISILADSGFQSPVQPLRLAVKDLRGPLEDGWEEKAAEWISGIVNAAG